MLQMESSMCERVGLESVAGAAGVAFRPHHGVSCGYSLIVHSRGPATQWTDRAQGLVVFVILDGSMEWTEQGKKMRLVQDGGVAKVSMMKIS